MDAVMHVLKVWKKTILSSMKSCSVERWWCRSTLTASWGTRMKMMTLATMITGVDQSVVTAPREYEVACTLAMPMKHEEMQEKSRSTSVVCTFFHRCCRLVTRRFVQMTSLGSGARVTSSLCDARK